MKVTPWLPRSRRNSSYGFLLPGLFAGSVIVKTMAGQCPRQHSVADGKFGCDHLE